MRQLSKMLTSLLTVSCLFFFLTSLATTPAMADPVNVTFSFTGTVDFVPTELAGFFSTGQALTGSFSFDSTIAARAGSTASAAVFDALLDLNFNLGGFTGSFSGGPSPEIQIENNLPGFNDIFAVLSRAGDGLTGSSPINGFTLSVFGLRLDDFNNTAFSTALALPTSLTLSDFENRQFFGFFTDSSGKLVILSGTINSLSATAAVPEPSSIWMLALGVAPVLLLWKHFLPGI